MVAVGERPKYRYKTRCLPRQAEVVRYANSTDPAEQLPIACRGAIRSGKTFILANLMLDRMERYPRARHIVVGAGLPQLKAGALKDFGDLLDSLGIEYDYNRTDGSYTLKKNGARLEAVSAEMRERIRSRSADTIWVEEPQTWNDGKTVFEVLFGRLSKSPEGMRLYPEMMPKMWLSFNPRQTHVGHWLWVLIVEKKAFKEFVFRTRDNFLMQFPGGIKAYVKLQQSILSEDLQRVELDGEWATFGGAVYRYYSQKVHEAPPDGMPPYGYDETLPLMWSLDFNFGLMCSVVAQMQRQIPIIEYTGKPLPEVRMPVKGWQEHVLYVLGELRLENADVYVVLAEFLRVWGERARKNGVWLYGDATGAGHSQTSGATLEAASNWHIIVNGLRKAGIKVFWQVQSANPHEIDRVNEVNAQFMSGDGPGVVIPFEAAPYTVQDLQAVKWTTSKVGDVVTPKIDKKSDGTLTHLSDALGYMIWFTRMRRFGEIALRQLEGIDFMER